MAFLRGLSILIINSTYLCDSLYLVFIFHLFKMVFSLFLCYCFLLFLCLPVSPSCSRKMSGSSEDDSDFDITPWLAAPAPNFSPDSKSPHTLWDILNFLFSCAVVHWIINSSHTVYIRRRILYANKMHMCGMFVWKCIKYLVNNQRYLLALLNLLKHWFAILMQQSFSR